MNIRTKEFNLTEKEVRQIHFKLNLRNQRWTILILVAIGILDFILNLLSNQAFSWSFYCFFLVALLIAYPLLVRIKRQNNLNFQTRYAEVDGDFFIMHFQDGSLIKLRYELFRKVIKINTPDSFLNGSARLSESVVQGSSYFIKVNSAPDLEKKILLTAG